MQNVWEILSGCSSTEQEDPPATKGSILNDQKMRAYAYLTFNGNCVEAFDFYKSVFGGTFGTSMTYEGSDKIMHISLPIASNMDLMGCDYHDSYHKEAVSVGSNVAVCLSTTSKAETDKLFAALIEKTHMPLKDMFWGAYHGSGVDKFGIRWMFDCGMDKDEEVKVAVTALKREVESLETMVSNKKVRTT